MNAVTTAIAAINNAADSNSMVSAIKTYKTTLGLDSIAYNTYFTSSKSSQSRINTPLIVPVWTTISDIQAAFSASVTAEAVYVINIQLFNYMDRDLRIFAGTLGLVLTDYDALGNKDPVLTAMVAEPFTTAAHVKEYFDSLVDQQKALEAIPLLDAFNNAPDPATMGNLIAIFKHYSIRQIIVYINIQ